MLAFLPTQIEYVQIAVELEASSDEYRLCVEKTDWATCEQRLAHCCGLRTFKLAIHSSVPPPDAAEVEESFLAHFSPSFREKVCLLWCPVE